MAWYQLGDKRLPDSMVTFNWYELYGISALLSKYNQLFSIGRHYLTMPLI